MRLRDYLILASADLLEKRRILPHYREFKKVEYANWEVLRHLQQKRLGRLLRHAAETVPYYRKLFAETGVDPAASDPIAEIQRLPLLSKSDLKASHEQILSSTFKKEQLIPFATGGSTGTPVSILLTPDQNDARAAVSLKAYQHTGWDFRVPTVFLSGEPIERSRAYDRKSRIKGALLSQRYLSSFDLSEENLARIADQVRRMNPKVIFGYVSSLVRFAEFVESKGHALEIPIIVQMAEMIYPHQQEYLERVLGGRFFKHYGARDAIAMGIECNERCGLHANMDTLLIEILKDGVDAGAEEGEVVVTDLFSYGMPLIRYRLGDVARWRSEVCPCGRKTPIFEVTQGRVTNVISTRDGGRLPGLFFPHLFKEVAASIAEYQVYQPDLDSLILRIVRRDGYGDGTEVYLKNKIQERLGPQVVLGFDYVERIQAEASGKYLFVKSDVRASFGNE